MNFPLIAWTMNQNYEGSVDITPPEARNSRLVFHVCLRSATNVLAHWSRHYRIPADGEDYGE
jgi:hypothetical protein